MTQGGRCVMPIIPFHLMIKERLPCHAIITSLFFISPINNFKTTSLELPFPVTGKPHHRRRNGNR